MSCKLKVELAHRTLLRGCLVHVLPYRHRTVMPPSGSVRISGEHIIGTKKCLKYVRNIYEECANTILVINKQIISTV